jgi:5-methylcytosine-specific restriction endonuclease McrA
MAYKNKEKQREYQLKWITKRRSDWIKSQGGECAECGSSDQLEVDHIDPKTKKWNPAQIWSRNQSSRDKELEKCQVLCYECHNTKSSAHKSIIHRGTSHNSKLNESQVIEIRIRLRNGEVGAKIGRDFNVTRYTISDIKLNKSWSHIQI